MVYNTIILGAGAAGLMCAAFAGGSCLVLDHAKAPAEKVRISGGGRCNFTNLYASAENYISENPHFAKSALARYTQWDFLDLIAKHKIAYHEKTLGQLFCDNSARDVIDMLLAEASAADAQVWLQTSIIALRHDGAQFQIDVDRQGVRRSLSARHIVLATGGKSIPKMGASGLAYDLAQQFDLRVTDTRPALVPLTFSDNRFAELSGLSVPVRATANGPAFDEAMLFTHRGLSGPSILQISSYWREGDTIRVNLDPDGTFLARLRDQRSTAGRQKLATALGAMLPARFIAFWGQQVDLSRNLADYSDAHLGDICGSLRDWQLRPSGTEGYRKAEVTLGGIACDGLDSKTMAAKHLPNLFAIGEAVDVTGWLGGYNFQWAWASAVAAGREIAAHGRAV